MDWTRAKDWLIGAAGMILVLVISVGIFWWAVSDPAGDGARSPSPSGAASPSPSSSGAEASDSGTTEVEPPADLGEDDVWLADLVLDAGTVVTSDSLLRDVHAVGQDVLTGPEGLVAAQLTVEATVPFDIVADELGGGSEVGAADDGQVQVVRTVEAFGRELRIVATGTVDVEAGRLVMEPRSIDVGGPDFLSDATAAVVRRFVTIEHSIEGLPEGLVLRDVAVQDDGFRADLRGEDVLLGQ